MSTILDALRKAKAEPPKNVVDARREILSDNTHDYLASAPGSSEGMLIVLKIGIGVCVLVILALGAIVLGMMKGREEATQPPAVVETREAANPPPSEPVRHVEPRRYAAEPVVQVRLQRPLVVKPPLRAQESPTQQPVQAPAATPQEKSPPPTTIPVPTAILMTRPQPAPAPHAGGPSPLGDMKLQGIVWDEKSPMAMIDGKLLKQGSRIGPAKVVRIESDAVVLRVDGREYVLGH